MRHAQTRWNGENRLQGHSDRPLSLLGRRQAKRLAAHFASRHLRRIFTSALTRSHETARAIAAGNGHEMVAAVEADLAEISLGAWEGLTPEEINERFQGAYQRWWVRPSSVRIPHAEPFDAFRRRVRRAVGRIMASFTKGECVVVSHGGVIAMVLSDALGADYDQLLRQLRLDNAGITAVEFWGGVPHVLGINATSHLDGL